jgi:hypothetical protein
MESDMTIKVEFLAGTDIKEAITEAKRKADLWQVAYIIFDFNGTSFSIGPNADIETVLEHWRSTLGKKYEICAA